jgi:uncharacterized delta-60 repeat protein
MAAGALNTAFGTGGLVTTGVRGSGNDQAAVVAVLPSGKILAAGETAYSPFNDFVSLARYNANGSLDPSFGTGGRLVTDFLPGQFSEQTTVTGLAVQPDGKYVVAATVTGLDANFNTVSFIALARYRPDGSLDTSFGSGGLALSTAFEATDSYGNPVYSDGAHGVALQPDGHIVVSGSALVNDATGQPREVVALAYFNRAGALDPSFGAQGVVTTTLAGQSAGGNDIVGLPDGSVLVGATSISDAYEVGSYNVLAYDRHGSLIPSFGNNGVATLTLSNAPAGYYGNDGLGNINRVGHIVVGPLGKIDVSGIDYYQDASGSSVANYAVVQFTSLGAVNPLFGGQGTGAALISSDAASYSPSPDLAVQHDGSIVVAGTAVNFGQSSAPATAEDFQVTRLLPPGTPDPSFGNGGTVTTDFAGAADYAAAVAVQPNGRIVVAGSAWETSAVTLEASTDYALARYLPNGTLDKSFGKGGKATTDFYGASADFLAGVIVQSNGQIVAAGDSTIGTAFGLIQGTSVDLVRYNADGSLDTSFGNAGRILTQIPTTNAPPGIYDYLTAEAVVQQGDGKILVVGYDLTTEELLAIRYTANGALDPTFGNGGIVLDPVGWGASSVVIQPDSKIVLAGTDYAPGDGNPADIALLRLNADGTNDTMFGAGGVVLTNVNGQYDEATGVALQSTGAIVVAGSVAAPFPGDGAAAVLRFTPSGALDTTFGAGGVAVTGAAGFYQATSVLVQPNDQILIGGSATGASDVELAVARFTAGGSLDTTFGGSGTGIALADFGYDAQANAMALQPDGSIVAVGLITVPVIDPTTGFETDVTSFAAARFTPSGAWDSTFGTGGEVVVGFDGQDALALAVALESNGNIVVAGDINTDVDSVDFAIVCLLGDTNTSH